jgi:hypothetical protein
MVTTRSPYHRLLASRCVSTTANGAVTITSLEPEAASRRLDFESTTGGAAMRAMSAPDSNQPTRVCLGEGDLPDTCADRPVQAVGLPLM